MEWAHITTIDRCYCQVAGMIAIDYVMMLVFNANIIA